MDQPKNVPPDRNFPLHREKFEASSPAQRTGAFDGVGEFDHIAHSHVVQGSFRRVIRMIGQALRVFLARSELDLRSIETVKWDLISNDPNSVQS